MQVQGGAKPGGRDRRGPGHPVAVQERQADRGPGAAKDPVRDEQVVDPDLSAAVSYSLQQTVEARLLGVRNYTRLLREVQRSR